MTNHVREVPVYQSKYIQAINYVAFQTFQHAKITADRRAYVIMFYYMPETQTFKMDNYATGEVLQLELYNDKMILRRCLTEESANGEQLYRYYFEELYLKRRGISRNSESTNKNLKACFFYTILRK